MISLGRIGPLTYRIILGLLLAIVLIVLLHTPEETGACSGAKPVLLEMMALALVGLALGQARVPRSGERIIRFLRTGPSLPILLLVLYGALSWHRSSARDFSAAEWIRLACGAALYFVVSATLHQRRQIKIIVGVLTTAAVLTALVGLFTFGETDATTVSSSFGNAQLFAGFLLLLAPLLVALSFSDLGLKLKQKAAIQGAAVLTITALLLAQVRSAWLGAAVALVALAVIAVRSAAPDGVVRRRSQFVAPLVTVAGAVGVFLMLTQSTPLLTARGQTLANAASDVDIRWRLNEWQGACALIRERPLFGWGIGTFPLEQSRTVRGGTPRAEVQRRGPSLSEEAHNEYLQIGAEMGMVGLGLHLWVLGAFALYGVRALRGRERGIRRLVVMGCLAAVAGQAVDAVSNPAWRFADVSLLFWVIMGLGTAAARFTPTSAAQEAPAPARRADLLGRLGWQVVTLAFTLFAMSGAWAAQYSDDEATSPASGDPAAVSTPPLFSTGQIVGLVLLAGIGYGAYSMDQNAHDEAARGFAQTPFAKYNSPDFSLALSPASLTIPHGKSGAYTVTLSALNGFNAAVSLSSSVAPALQGSLTLGATSVTPSGTTTLQVKVSGSATPGSYTVTVTGTSGGLTHSASATLVVS